MARERRRARTTPRLDQPRETSRPLLSRPQVDPEKFGRNLRAVRPVHGHGAVPRLHDGVRRALAGLEHLRARAACSSTRATLNYTLLTLILSLQASYAAPLILLAQNRQDDRDRVVGRAGPRPRRAQPGRHRVPDPRGRRLRIALRDVATRDFVRSELRSLLEELEERGALRPVEADDAARG